MKKLNLNETWERCMCVWRLVVAKIKAGPDETVEILKREAINELYPNDDPQSNCYFCEYSFQHNTGDGCSACPGRLIDPKFACNNDHYHFAVSPIAFLAKLESVYAEYKTKEIKQK